MLQRKLIYHTKKGWLEDYSGVHGSDRNYTVGFFYLFTGRIQPTYIGVKKDTIYIQYTSKTSDV